MGRQYSIAFSAVAVTAAQDLFEIQPADDKPVAIRGLFIGQTSDAGDSQDEQLQVSIIRGYTTSGSGGSSGTINALNPSDAAAGFTAEINNTTVATTGTGAVLHTEAFNVRAGYGNWWPPENMPRATQGNTTIVVRITAPADSLTMSGTLYVEED